MFWSVQNTALKAHSLYRWDATCEMYNSARIHHLRIYIHIDCLRVLYIQNIQRSFASKANINTKMKGITMHRFCLHWFWYEAFEFSTDKWKDLGFFSLYLFICLNASSWWLNQVCPVFSNTVMFHQSRYNIVVQTLESKHDQKASCLR